MKNFVSSISAYIIHSSKIESRQKRIKSYKSRKARVKKKQKESL